MPLNAGYEYVNAEKKYAQASTLDEKITALEEMIKTAPKHKSSEHHVSELKNRLRRFLEKKEKAKSVGKSTLKSIKKEGFQVVLLGLTNSGKSTLLSRLTNAKPKISQNLFSTIEPEIGTLDFEGFKAQIVDIPSIGSQYFDSGIVNNADCLLLVIEKIEDLDKVIQFTLKNKGEKIIIINKIDLLSNDDLRKLGEKIKTKRLNAVAISALENIGIFELKRKIINSMPYMRIYMKEPGKSPSNVPLILKINSSLKDAAESIYKGFSSKIKEARVTGPSSKFPNQRVGLSHILKDKDIIEFHTS